MANLFGPGNCLTPELREDLGVTRVFPCVPENTCGQDARTVTQQYELHVPGQSYSEGDTVYVLEDNGRLIEVFTATDAPSFIPGEPAWEKKCVVRTTEPAGLPEYSTISELYDYYIPGTEYSFLDIVMVKSGCEDISCVYVSLMDENIDSPLVASWKKLYCVGNGSPSTCKKTVKCGPNRRVVSLSRPDDDLVCIPVESRL